MAEWGGAKNSHGRVISEMRANGTKTNNTENIQKTN